MESKILDPWMQTPRMEPDTIQRMDHRLNQLQSEIQTDLTNAIVSLGREIEDLKQSDHGSKKMRKVRIKDLQKMRRKLNQIKIKILTGKEKNVLTKVQTVAKAIDEIHIDNTSPSMETISQLREEVRDHYRRFESETTKVRKEMDEAIARVEAIGSKLEKVSRKSDKSKILSNLSHLWDKIMHHSTSSPSDQMKNFIKYGGKVDNILLDQKDCRLEATKLQSDLKEAMQQVDLVEDVKVKNALLTGIENIAEGRRDAYRNYYRDGSSNNFKSRMKELRNELRAILESVQ